MPTDEQFTQMRARLETLNLMSPLKYVTIVGIDQADPNHRIRYPLPGESNDIIGPKIPSAQSTAKGSMGPVTSSTRSSPPSDMTRVGRASLLWQGEGRGGGDGGDTSRAVGGEILLPFHPPDRTRERRQSTSFASRRRRRERAL